MAAEENTWIVSERLSFVGAMCGGAGVNTESAIRAMVAPRSGHEGGEKSLRRPPGAEFRVSSRTEPTKVNSVQQPTL